LDVNIAKLLDIEAQGASKIDLRGTCETLKINGFGASDIKASELKAKNADIHLSGASHADVFASESLNAEAFGASNINCKGQPKQIKKSTHIGSEINVE